MIADGLQEAQKNQEPGVLRELARVAMLVALLAVSSYIAFPLLFSPVPVSAQTLMVTMTAFVLPPRQAARALSIYLIIGLIGVPVFARGASGVGVFAGPTGGFLVGFWAAAVVMSLLNERLNGKKAFGGYLLIAFLGSLVVLVLGVLWMAAVTSLSPASLLSVAVWPFIPGDIFKCLAAAFLAKALGRTLIL